MNRFGHQTLAGAGLTVDQNGAVTVGHAPDQFEDAAHCSAFADDALKARFVGFNLIVRLTGTILLQGDFLDIAYCHLDPPYSRLIIFLRLRDI